MKRFVFGAPGCLLTLVPGEYDTDGFFIAKLRRKA